MFDNLFLLLGPVASAGALFGVIALVSIPAFAETCALQRRLNARGLGPRV
jgi:hypothetical protein